MIPQREIFAEEHEIFRDAVRRFLNTEIVPHLDQWEKDGIVPKHIWRNSGEQGLLCPTVPEAYGGIGGDFRYNAVVSEETAYTGYSFPSYGVHSDIVPEYLLHCGSEEQKKAWLPKMVRGEAVAAIAMTEPDTGSDLRGVRTTARRDGNYYVINGAKTFITNGQNADIVIVVCRTGVNEERRDLSLVLVEGDRKGFRRGRNLEKLGQKGADTSELYFEDVRVPAENLLGEPGSGMSYLMRELAQERLAVGFGAMGATQLAYDLAVQYVTDRKAFGRPIREFQNTRFKLAEAKTEMTVGWAYLDHCLAKHLKHKLTATDGAMAKLWLTEMQGRVVDSCLQLFGGYGYMSEYPISRLYADARVQRIYGGTSEIMKELISRDL